MGNRADDEEGDATVLGVLVGSVLLGHHLAILDRPLPHVARPLVVHLENEAEQNGRLQC